MYKQKLYLKFKFVVTLFIFSLSIFHHGYSFAEGSGSKYFIDLLILQDGKTPQDAEDYFKVVVPIAASHGLVRIHSFTVDKILGGEIKPQLVNLWTLSSGHVFEEIGSDPRYKKMIPNRNHTFDMKHSSMLILDQPQ